MSEVYDFAADPLNLPLRVISDGDECEVVFTLRQRPDMTNEDFEGDADAVAADLATLKSLVEAP